MEQTFKHYKFGKLFAVVVLECSIITLITLFIFVKTNDTLGVNAFLVAVALFCFG